MAKSISISFFKNLINKGHSRTVQAKKNILALLFYKGLTIGMSLLIVPLTVNYLNPSNYGIWITLTSVIGWIGIFDIGFGNGLRNKFTESVARGKNKLAKIYVSTTYAILAIVIFLGFLLFLCLNPLLNWPKILNAPFSMAGELSRVVIVVFSFFCLQFVLQLITTVMTAKQEPGKASLFNFIGSAVSLLVVFILTKTSHGNLFYLASTLSVIPVFVLLGTTFWFYKFEYKAYAPSINFVKFSYARNLMGVGVKFFMVQIGALILFQTDNIVISQLFGPQEVTKFNIALKLFSVITMIFNIIVTPLWSAFTDAYATKDFKWINDTFKKMYGVFFLIVIITFSILGISPFLFNLWLGSSIEIPFAISLGFSFYIIAYSWQTIHVFFLNGIGKVGLQLYLVLISSVINIPLSIYLGKFIGLTGVIVSNTLLFTIMGIIFFVQTKKILNHSATGIWDK